MPSGRLITRHLVDLVHAIWPTYYTQSGQLITRHLADLLHASWPTYYTPSGRLITRKLAALLHGGRVITQLRPGLVPCLLR